ncbi:hypothetical protein GOP47_0020402 [Adiantum capillus-veneris]|uniref:Glutaredoxin domain-containing protein n=1 Tax=Adiantum capillus-veneris TaxID=13818 RepID=A0A9D4Z9J1_ADICA|nr:hypothetical protein GOP47_0020402 [Adiantum capillus-veneris]
MGCVTSKHLKKQAISDGWTSPPSRTIPPRPKTLTSGYSVECYHRHFVSLTSTSYGSLKVESPKHAERTPVASLSDMYGKLRSLEAANSVHDAKDMRNIIGQSPSHASDSALVAAALATPFSNIDSNNYHVSQATAPVDISSLNGISIMHSTFCPSPIPQNSPTALESGHQWSMNSAGLGLPETINVTEMMMGLEDAAPLSQNSSPTKHTHSNVSTPRTKALQQHNQLHLKRKAEGSLKVTHTFNIKKGVADACKEWNQEDNGAGKENKSPLHVQHIKKASPKKAPLITGSPAGNCALSQTSNSSFKSATTQKAREFRPVQQASIVARKAAFERGSSFTNSQPESSSPGLSSASTASARSVHYTPSNGKVRLTLHTHQHGSASIASTPSPLPVRTMSRRRAFGGSNQLNSPTFDPELVASYEKVLSDVSQVEWDATHVGSPSRHLCSSTETSIPNAGRPWLWSSMSMPTAALDKRLYDPLECFQEKCPPGGANAVVLYTTTLRGIRKTFEDCNTAREIFQSFGLSIDERDVSMHLEFLNELRQLMGRVVSVPRMFIKGRYVGGVEEVVKLHEDGKLSELVEGLPKQLNAGSCDGCGGVRFVPCLECRGSCKLRNEEDGRVIRCPHCNENGLIQCPICT